MTVDFGRLIREAATLEAEVLEAQLRGEASAQLERDLEVRFDIRRGSFTIPAGLKAADPERWAYLFASQLPEGEPDVTSYRNGAVEVFTWRIVTPRWREV